MLTPEQKLSYKAKGVVDEVLMEFLEDTKNFGNQIISKDLALCEETVTALESFTKNNVMFILSDLAHVMLHINSVLIMGVWLGVTGRAKIGERKLDS